MEQDQAEALFDAAFRVLRMMGRLFSRDQAACRITPTQYHALYLIQDHGTQTLMDLAKHLQVSAPTATRSVEVLAQKALAVKERDPQDRRVVWVSLSPNGEALLTRERAEHVDYLAHLAQHRLSTAEQAQLIVLMNKLVPPEIHCEN